MKTLHLVLETFPPARVAELRANAEDEVFLLTDENAKEALQKIFAAESICVWTRLHDT